MEDILIQISKVRQKLKKKIANNVMDDKPFGEGMYRFSMFMISYYARVCDQLKIDYDSFMIVQTVVSHNLYHLQKKNRSIGYEELEEELSNATFQTDKIINVFSSSKNKKTNTKLTISSVCLVTGLPKETVRRKIHNLVKKNILKLSKKEGVLLGVQYKKIFQDFVPQTTLEVSKLVKHWKKTGVLENLLNFKI